MRYLIAALAILGIVVSVLAFQIHYSNAVQPCDINSHWDCGIVNHSRYSMIGKVPVAAVGIVGYFILGVLAFMRRRSLTLIASLLGRVPIPGATVTVDGLVLVAESAKGRRNRIGTVLVRRADLPDHEEQS